MSKYLQNQKRGFTIIELMLAMSFLSILLVILVLSTMYFVSTYNKGITLKRVNQSGRTIGSTLQSSLKSSQGGAFLTNSTGTRLCVGGTNYVWSLYTNTKNVDDKFVVKNETYDNGDQIGFAKTTTGGPRFCTDSSIKAKKAESTELIGDGLVMRVPTRFVKTSDGKLITAIFTIATPDESSDFAVPPNPSDPNASVTCGEGQSTEDSFCALNTFVVTAYTTGYNH